MLLQIGDCIVALVDRYDVRKGDRLSVTGIDEDGIWVWNTRTNSASFLYHGQYRK